MLASNLYAPTLREVPAEAELISHKLMLRAGMIRKSAAGMYTYLPLALRTLRKIETIVREEMDAKGGQELLMPIAQPAEIWQESGRWAVYGDEMWRVNDRHGRNFCLGPTHEELITTLVRGEVRSYKQLPVLLYQIQDKFRDERRPRFGLMRGREFIMKDLYSFDKDEASLDISYNKMYDAYSNVFARCGLNFRPVEADSGAIGGSGSHEFMAIADAGEAEIVYCSQCDYAGNTEKAELKAVVGAAEPMAELQLVDTPNAKTNADVAAFLNVPLHKTIKAVDYITDKGVVVAMVRGDHEVNEIKIVNAVNALFIEMAGAEDLQNAGIVAGFTGGVNQKKAMVIVDHTVMEMFNAVCGGDQVDKHYINVNPQRDFKYNLVADIRLIQEGDPCPKCGAEVKKARGIEVGQVFKLFTKYSEVLKATFLDENGKEKPMVMGCYGIGVSRTMAAIIEQSNDADGIIWPVSVAPYEVVIIPANTKDEQVMKVAEEVYCQLRRAGMGVVLDERNERAGVKFKDADLIGYPLRITIGAKTLEAGCIETRIRKNGEVGTIMIGSDYASEACRVLSSI